MAKLSDRLRNGWNAFVNNKDPSREYRDYRTNYDEYAYVSSTRPDRVHFSFGIDRNIISAIYNRMAVDAASCDMYHARMKEDISQFEDIIPSNLNTALTLSANIDQTGRALREDIFMSLIDEGCIAIVPVDIDTDPDETDSYNIYTLRVGKIVEWYPSQVKVELYNDRKGIKQNLMFDKSEVAIVENPFYTIMNEPNGTLKRLIYKMNLLDKVDAQNSSGKLDLIIQLPYVIKTETKRKEAEKRRKDIEMQLTGSKYGIAYTDGTEHITQLNRPVENTLVNQIKDLIDRLYSQLGLTQEILNGSATPEAMQNYYARTIEPLVSAVTDEMTRKFLTKTAITQRQRIIFVRDPFKIIPVEKVANIADTFTRNEIMSSNEVRGIIGRKPSKQKGADDLRNKNLNQATEELKNDNQKKEQEEIQNGN